MMEGIFQLRSASDLLRKLRFDLEQLKKRPSDPYAAFNFFVTAEHMPEWLYPGNIHGDTRREIKASSLLMQVCSHLANGAKHFQTDDKRHKSVAATGRTGGYWASSYWASSYWAPSYWAKGGVLVVELQGDAAKDLGDRITAVALAGRVLTFWESRPELSGTM